MRVCERMRSFVKPNTLIMKKPFVSFCALDAHGVYQWGRTTATRPLTCHEDIAEFENNVCKEFGLRKVFVQSWQDYDEKIIPIQFSPDAIVDRNYEEICRLVNSAAVFGGFTEQQISTAITEKDVLIFPNPFEEDSEWVIFKFGLFEGKLSAQDVFINHKR